jgi:K+-sensing histidine kinase KdpD
VQRDARFAGDVSHELRSPLTTMVNVSEVLQRWRAESRPRRAQAAALLASEVQRFRTVPRAVLDSLSSFRSSSDDSRPAVIRAAPDRAASTNHQKVVRHRRRYQAPVQGTVVKERLRRKTSDDDRRCDGRRQRPASLDQVARRLGNCRTPR